jgi:membrane fusion protein (multidrug efflux system)
MNRSLRVTITVIIVLLIVGTIAFPKLKPFLASRLKKEVTAGGPMRQMQQKLFASGYIIRPADMSEEVPTMGTLRPDEEVDLSFETSGKIMKIYFVEGTSVRKGDLLAKINDRPLQAQLEKLQVQKKLAEAKEFRQRSLLDRDAISQESYDQIQTELQSTIADINLVTARIAETELRAPFDGYIGLRYLSEGAYATPSTKIAKLIKSSPLKIEFSVAQQYATELSIGYPISFRIDGIDKNFDARIYAVDPKIDINTRTIAARALYPNINGELKPGRSAYITIQLSKIEKTVAIPSQALISEMEGEKVFIYRNGKASAAKVLIGLRTESSIQVKEGLSFGDTLLITGILQLRQNLPIQLDTVITNTK